MDLDDAVSFQLSFMQGFIQIMLLDYARVALSLWER